MDMFTLHDVEAVSLAMPPAAPDLRLHDAADLLARSYWLRLAHAELSRPRSGLRRANIEDDLQSVLGLSRRQVQQLEPAALLRRLVATRATLQDCESACALLDARLDGTVARLGIDEVSRELLMLANLVSRNRMLANLCRQTDVYSPEDAGRLLAPALGRDATAIGEALQPQAPLVANGLLRQGEDCTDLCDFLTVPRYVRVGVFAAEPFEDFLLHRVFAANAAPPLGVADFGHLPEEIALIRAALRRTTGAAHVLLAGPPGVGKTQLARCIGHDLGWRTLEVRVDDVDGDPSQRSERFRHYALGCKLLGRSSGTLVIFDEAEDVFTGEHWTHVKPGEGRHKGWTNRLLETVEVPTIWISNSLAHIDPAYLRRFDYVLEMRTPPRSARRRLLDSATRDSGASSALVERIAESESFTPADADRIARVLPRALAEGLAADVALRQLATCRP